MPEHQSRAAKPAQRPPAAPRAPAPAAKPAAAAKPSAAAKAAPAKPAAAAPGRGGYSAQQRAQSPKDRPQHVQGATLQNNQSVVDKPQTGPKPGQGPAREQGRPAGQSAVPEAARPPGTFQVKGQEFASLADVQAWIEAEKPQDAELVIQCTPGSQVQVGAQCLWTYYNPNQKIVLDGQGAAVSGLQQGRPTQGYFLSYRPTIGQVNTAATAAAANLTVRNLSIRGFEAGGIEISPQAEAGKEHEWDGGVRAFVSGALIEGVDFRDLGNSKTKRKDRVWNNMRFGAGGVVMRGVQNSTIADCDFANLTNGEQTRYVTDPKTGETKAVEEDGNHLIHAVYLNNGSSGNTVTNNRFDGVGGDPIRVSNGSNNNVIDGNRARNSGQHALVNNWFKSAKGEQDSTGTVIRNNKIGQAYGKNKQLGTYVRKESRGTQAPVNNTAV